MSAMSSCPSLVFGATVFMAGFAPYAAPAGNVIVRFRPPVKDVACQVWTGSRAVPLSATGVTCPDETSTLRCEASGFEPVDVPLADVCANNLVTLQRAVSVGIQQPPAAVPLHVEWIDVATSGVVRVNAVRTFAAAEHVEIAVGESAGRMVRFNREGASPVTVPASQLTGPDRRWSLPDAVRGGEIVGIVEDAPVKAAGVHLDDVSSGPMTRRTGFVSTAQGVTAGQHVLTPFYSGGLTGTPVRANAETGASTVVWLHPEAVGAVDLRGPVGGCEGLQQASIERVLRVLDPRVRRSSVLETAVRLEPSQACSWRVAGLSPGLYSAALEGEGWRAQGRFEVQTQRVSAAQATRGVTVASGRVTLNGAPYGERVIRFKAMGSPDVVDATTDTDGHYSATLHSPGQYLVTVGGGAAIRKVLLDIGENSLDWALSGGVLTVRVEGTIDHAMIEVSSRQFLGVERVRPESPEFKWEGLPFADYEVSAHGGNAASSVSRVSLTPETSEVEIALKLKGNHAQLALRDDNGVPVSAAKFNALTSGPIEVSPGVYSLEGVPAGMPLVVRPPGDLVPTCRIVPDDSDLDVRLARGREATIKILGLERYELGEGMGRVEGIDGAQCGVLLTAFSVLRVSEPSASELHVTLANFPLLGALTLRTGVGVYPFVSSDTGSISVTRSR